VAGEKKIPEKDGAAAAEFFKIFVRILPENRDLKFLPFQEKTPIVTSCI
jgi:hypothetical protein